MNSAPHERAAIGASSPARRRAIWALCLASVAGLLGYAYYAQYRLYLDPCPLCITQRAFYLGIGVASIVGLATARRTLGQRIAAGLMLLSAVGGIVTAGRQVWLQHLPPDLVPACGPGLQYWLDNNPWFETLTLLFKGDGNCAEVHWRFLGLSMGEWSLAWFTGFLVLALVLLVGGLRRRGRSTATRVDRPRTA